ncbi:hypothetical protein PCIT_a3063 [Pseudoalteromonas citrea]|uniref:Uncharacterized protein n=2 Tax=Pseudoalteromonas citrea TaxID=43655 RepID=A0AAD4AI54_9GAMM|nr:hypothetical protein [Pseudoalteromonas citrea]KAF7770104.1 hypothetical protein PCIT_a3063 [Pseudoalteromonas citrea]
MNKVKATEHVYTAREYAEQVCYGKVTYFTVRNWVKKWLTEGGLPSDHRLITLPNGRVLIVVNDANDRDLLNHLVANR